MCEWSSSDAVLVISLVGEHRYCTVDSLRLDLSPLPPSLLGRGGAPAPQPPTFKPNHIAPLTRTSQQGPRQKGEREKKQREESSSAEKPLKTSRDEVQLHATYANPITRWAFYDHVHGGFGHVQTGHTMGK